jgi:hypothetical protein
MALGIQVCERTVSVLMTRAGIYGAGQDGDLDLFVSGAACRDVVVSDQQTNQVRCEGLAQHQADE